MGTDSGAYRLDHWGSSIPSWIEVFGGRLTHFQKRDGRAKVQTKDGSNIGLAGGSVRIVSDCFGGFLDSLSFSLFSFSLFCMLILCAFRRPLFRLSGCNRHEDFSNPSFGELVASALQRVRRGQMGGCRIVRQLLVTNMPLLFSPRSCLYCLLE